MRITSKLSYNEHRQITDGVGAVLITREHAWPKDAEPDFPFDELTTHAGCPNVYQRYVDAATSTCEHIYVQDDDCRINTRQLWEHYDRRHITNANSKYFIDAYAGTGTALVGWGCFFPRVLCERFVELEQELRRMFGDDLFFTEADRIFTFLNQPHHTVEMPIMMFQRNTDRLSSRPNHYHDRQQVFSILKEAFLV
jgi:hypothetical protein